VKVKLQKNWKQYLVMGLIGVWIIAFIAIFYISAEAGCTDSGGILKSEGICLTRGIAGLSCFAGFLGLWTFLGGEVARGKGRNPLIGMILGLTLEFMGCLFMMTWEPRRDFTGRMIGGRVQTTQPTTKGIPEPGARAHSPQQEDPGDRGDHLYGTRLYPVDNK